MGGGGGGGATPICGPYKYVPPDKLWFVRVSNLKQGIIFAFVSVIILV